MQIKINFVAILLTITILASPLLTYSQDSQEEASSTPEIIAEEPTPAVEDPEITATTTAALQEEPATEAVATTTAATTTETLIDEVATTTETTATTTETSSDSNDTSDLISTTTINSGEAIALANILNIVNTNFINSEGVILFSNFFEYLAETLDLRNALTGNPSCAQTPCASGEEVNINVSNNAAIDNEVILEASTGGNQITGAEEAIIDTGNAYAGLNLINLANNNFVDSNYLLVTLNAFGDIGGDIVFPNLADFFNSLSSGANDPSVISLENEAEINNQVSTETESGNNEVTAASSTITTGNTHSSSNVFNEINSTLAGDSKVSILFRVHGNWAGEIFGAPDGLSWLQSNGSIFLFDNASSTNSSQSSGHTNLTSTSTALINNNVSVVALTGENQITNAETALISTGNAYAGVNIVNVANSNVIGKNWILAIINIFGDFTGNIAFGRPDLWTGALVETPDKVSNGNELIYRFTIINNGDSPSSRTALINNYDQEHLEIIDSSAPYNVGDGGQLVWDLGTLAPSSASEISYRAKVINTDYETAITNTATVAGHETDNNLSDNTDSTTVITAPAPNSGNSSGYRINKTPKVDTQTGPTSKQLEVTRDNFVTTLSEGETQTTQKLVINNTGLSPIDGVVLHDILKDPTGQIIHDEIWNLGTVLAKEEITLAYAIQFDNEVPNGLYTLTTVFDGFQNNNLPNGYLLLSGNREIPTVTEIVLAAEPAVASTTEPEPPAAPIAPTIALGAAVKDQTTTKLPPISSPLITLIVMLSLWSGYRYKFGQA